LVDFKIFFEKFSLNVRRKVPTNNGLAFGNNKTQSPIETFFCTTQVRRSILSFPFLCMICVIF